MDTTNIPGFTAEAAVPLHQGNRQWGVATNSLIQDCVKMAADGLDPVDEEIVAVCSPCR